MPMLFQTYSEHTYTATKQKGTTKIKNPSHLYDSSLDHLFTHKFKILKVPCRPDTMLGAEINVINKICVLLGGR